MITRPSRFDILTRSRQTTLLFTLLCCWICCSLTLGTSTELRNTLNLVKRALPRGLGRSSLAPGDVSEIRGSAVSATASTSNGVTSYEQYERPLNDAARMEPLGEFHRNTPQARQEERLECWKSVINRLTSQLTQPSHQPTEEGSDIFFQSLESVVFCIHSRVVDRIRAIGSVEDRLLIQTSTLPQGPGVEDVARAKMRPLQVIFTCLRFCVRFVNHSAPSPGMIKRLRRVTEFLFEGGVFKAENVLKRIFLSNQNVKILVFHLAASFTTGSAIDKLLQEGGLGNLPSLKFLHVSDFVIDEQTWKQFMLELIFQVYKDLLKKIDEEPNSEMKAFQALRVEEILYEIDKTQSKRVYQLAQLAARVIISQPLELFEEIKLDTKLWNFSYHMFKYILRFSTPSIQHQIKTELVGPALQMSLRFQRKLLEVVFFSDSLLMEAEHILDRVQKIREDDLGEWMRGPIAFTSNKLPFQDSLEREMALLGFSSKIDYATWLNHHDELLIWERPQRSDRNRFWSDRNRFWTVSEVKSLKSFFKHQEPEELIVSESTKVVQWMHASQRATVGGEWLHVFQEPDQMQGSLWHELQYTPRADGEKCWNLSLCYLEHIKRRLHIFGESDQPRQEQMEAGEPLLRSGLMFTPYIQSLALQIKGQANGFYEWLGASEVENNLQGIKTKWLELGTVKDLLYGSELRPSHTFSTFASGIFDL